MQITVNIPDELAAQVQARGIALETYVEQLVVDQADMSEIELDSAHTTADLEKFFAAMSAHSNKVPLLSDEAFTRENWKPL